VTILQCVGINDGTSAHEPTLCCIKQMQKVNVMRRVS